MVFPGITVAEGGERTLYVDYTVNGTRSLEVTVTTARRPT